MAGPKSRLAKYMTDSLTSTYSGYSDEALRIMHRDAVEQASRNPGDMNLANEIQKYEIEMERRSGVMNASRFERVGDKPEGFHPGGLFRGPSGDEWFFKGSHSEDHARSEVLAGRLYREAGVNVPDTELVDLGGRLGVASRKQDIRKIDPDNPPPGTHEGFAADAWLANRDVTGNYFDNIYEDAMGNALRIDQGGALRHKGVGTEKNFNPERVSELEGMRNPEWSPNASRMFRGVTDEQIHEGGERIRAIPEERIRELVDQYGPGGADEKEGLVKALLGRRATMPQVLAALGVGGAAAGMSEDAEAGPKTSGWRTVIQNRVTDGERTERLADAERQVEELERKLRTGELAPGPISDRKLREARDALYTARHEARSPSNPDEDYYAKFAPKEDGRATPGGMAGVAGLAAGQSEEAEAAGPKGRLAKYMYHGTSVDPNNSGPPEIQNRPMFFAENPDDTGQYALGRDEQSAFFEGVVNDRYADFDLDNWMHGYPTEPDVAEAIKQDWDSGGKVPFVMRAREVEDGRIKYANEDDIRQAALEVGVDEKYVDNFAPFQLVDPQESFWGDDIKKNLEAKGFTGAKYRDYDDYEDSYPVRMVFNPKEDLQFGKATPGAIATAGAAAGGVLASEAFLRNPGSMMPGMQDQARQRRQEKLAQEDARNRMFSLGEYAPPDVKPVPRGLDTIYPGASGHYEALTRNLADVWFPGMEYANRTFAWGEKPGLMEHAMLGLEATDLIPGVAGVMTVAKKKILTDAIKDGLMDKATPELVEQYVTDIAEQFGGLNKLANLPDDKLQHMGVLIPYANEHAPNIKSTANNIVQEYYGLAQKEPTPNQLWDQYQNPHNTLEDNEAFIHLLDDIAVNKDKIGQDAAKLDADFNLGKLSAAEYDKKYAALQKQMDAVDPDYGPLNKYAVDEEGFDLEGLSGFTGNSELGPEDSQISDIHNLVKKWNKTGEMLTPDQEAAAKKAGYTYDDVTDQFVKTGGGDADSVIKDAKKQMMSLDTKYNLGHIDDIQYDEEMDKLQKVITDAQQGILPKKSDFNLEDELEKLNDSYSPWDSPLAELAEQEGYHFDEYVNKWFKNDIVAEDLYDQMASLQSQWNDGGVDADYFTTKMDLLKQELKDHVDKNLLPGGDPLEKKAKKIWENYDGDDPDPSMAPELDLSYGPESWEDILNDLQELEAQKQKKLTQGIKPNPKIPDFTKSVDEEWMPNLPPHPGKPSGPHHKPLPKPWDMADPDEEELIDSLPVDPSEKWYPFADKQPTPKYTYDPDFDIYDITPSLEGKKEGWFQIASQWNNHNPDQTITTDLDELAKKYGPGVYGWSGWSMSQNVYDLGKNTKESLHNFGKAANEEYVAAANIGSPWFDEWKKTLPKGAAVKDNVPYWYDLSDIEQGLSDVGGYADAQKFRAEAEAQGLGLDYQSRMSRAMEQGYQPVGIHYTTANRELYSLFTDPQGRGSAYTNMIPHMAKKASQSGENSQSRSMPLWFKGKIFGRDPLPEWMTQPVLDSEFHMDSNAFRQRMADAHGGQIPANLDPHADTIYEMWKNSVRPAYSRRQPLPGENERVWEYSPDNLTPHLADTWVDNHAWEPPGNQWGESPNVDPMNWMSWEGRTSYDPDGTKRHNYYEASNVLGFDGWLVQDEGGISVATNQPNRFRSPHATFLPDRSADGPNPTNNILAGVGGLTAVSVPALMTQWMDELDDEDLEEFGLGYRSY